MLSSVMDPLDVLVAIIMAIKTDLSSGEAEKAGRAEA